jgi:transposase-like protein
MTKEDRDIQRKLKVLRHAEKTGHVARTCRYFGVGRSSFYRWRTAYKQRGEAGLVNAKPIPKNPANQTPPEIVDKVLYLRSKYHLGSIRIVWYLARYHGIIISDAGVTRILRRNGVGRLPRGTRMRKVHTKRYNKQVPGHHIQMDVKFLTFIGNRGEKIRRFQYTAIDDATRVRALKVYDKHTQANASICRPPCGWMSRASLRRRCPVVQRLPPSEPGLRLTATAPAIAVTPTMSAAV